MAYILLGQKSPFQILTGNVPSYDSLRVFGCLLYAHNIDRQKDKFTPRAIECIFIGYPLVKKDIKFMISHQTNVLLPEMSFFKKKCFLSHPILIQTHLLHLYPPIPIIDLHLDHISSPVPNSSLVRAISSGEMNTSLGFNPYLVKSISSYYESDSLSPQNLEFSTDPHISHNRNSSPTPPLSSTC